MTITQNIVTRIIITKEVTSNSDLYKITMSNEQGNSIIIKKPPCLNKKKALNELFLFMVNHEQEKNHMHNLMM